MYPTFSSFLQVFRPPTFVLSECQKWLYITKLLDLHYVQRGHQSSYEQVPKSSLFYKTIPELNFKPQHIFNGLFWPLACISQTRKSSKIVEVEFQKKRSELFTPQGIVLLRVMKNWNHNNFNNKECTLNRIQKICTKFDSRTEWKLHFWPQIPLFESIEKWNFSIVVCMLTSIEFQSGGAKNVFCNSTRYDKFSTSTEKFKFSWLMVG